jgi:hypothetical protein
VNGVSPPVGADAVTLKDGDRVLWYWATFGRPAGRRRSRSSGPKRNCYRVLAQDDNGKTTAARGAAARRRRSVPRERARPASARTAGS